MTIFQAPTASQPMIGRRECEPQVTSVAGGRDAVIEALNYQGRDVDRGQRHWWVPIPRKAVYISSDPCPHG